LSASGKFDFTLKTWAGTDPDYNTKKFDFSMPATWVPFPRPDFDLLTETGALSSADSIFRVNLINYDLGDPSISIKWSI
jgi:hypothetical protein